MRESYSIQLALATGALVLLVTFLFAVVQSPELFVSTMPPAPVMGHPLEGHRLCTDCHSREGIRPYPWSHVGWNLESCTKCHAPPEQKIPALPKQSPPVAPKSLAAKVPHPLAGMADCNQCHLPGQGQIPAPADHRGWSIDTCTGCHDAPTAPVQSSMN